MDECVFALRHIVYCGYVDVNRVIDTQGVLVWLREDILQGAVQRPVEGDWLSFVVDRSLKDFPFFGQFLSLDPCMQGGVD